ncbi:MAG: hypothetical protein ACYDH6_19565 [Acidimicrobiales bacterium]
MAWMSSIAAGRLTTPSPQRSGLGALTAVWAGLILEVAGQGWDVLVHFVQHDALGYGLKHLLIAHTPIYLGTLLALVSSIRVARQVAPARASSCMRLAVGALSMEVAGLIVDGYAHAHWRSSEPGHTLIYVGYVATPLLVVAAALAGAHLRDEGA